MKHVGLTGLIGSGKSLVAHIFEYLGVPVYYSDLRAKYLMEYDPELSQKIKLLLGSDAYDNTNKLNRKFIASKIFSNSELLQQLNSLVHPMVGLDYLEWAKQQNTPYVIKESALLLDVIHSQPVDKIIVVSASESIRIQRVMLRDKLSEQQVKNRIQHQRHESELIAQADYVIHNDGSSFITKQVLLIHMELLKFASQQ